jgi:hypothetical protein
MGIVKNVFYKDLMGISRGFNADNKDFLLETMNTEYRCWLFMN